MAMKRVSTGARPRWAGRLVAKSLADDPLTVCMLAKVLLSARRRSALCATATVLVAVG
jgi:hypothetical protein